MAGMITTEPKQFISGSTEFCRQPRSPRQNKIAARCKIKKLTINSAPFLPRVRRVHFLIFASRSAALLFPCRVTASLKPGAGGRNRTTDCRDRGPRSAANARELPRVPITFRKRTQDCSARPHIAYPCAPQDANVGAPTPTPPFLPKRCPG